MSKVNQNLKSGQLVILKVDTFSGPEAVQTIAARVRKHVIIISLAKIPRFGRGYEYETRAIKALREHMNNVKYQIGCGRT